MKLKGGGMAPISTQSACSARLGNEHLLDLAPPPGDRFGAAFRAAKPSFGSNRDMPGQAMLPTNELSLSISLLPHFGECLSSLGAPGPETVPFQPLLCSGIAYAEPLGNPFDRQALHDKGLDLLPIKTKIAVALT